MMTQEVLRSIQGQKECACAIILQPDPVCCPCRKPEIKSPCNTRPLNHTSDHQRFSTKYKFTLLCAIVQGPGQSHTLIQDILSLTLMSCDTLTISSPEIHNSTLHHCLIIQKFSLNFTFVCTIAHSGLCN